MRRLHPRTFAYNLIPVGAMHRLHTPTSKVTGEQVDTEWSIGCNPKSEVMNRVHTRTTNLIHNTVRGETSRATHTFTHTEGGEPPPLTLA